MSKAALDRLLEKFGDEVIETHDQHGDETAVVKPARVLEMMTFLRDDDTLAFEMLSDLTGVDLLGVADPRFQVVYHLYSLSKHHRLRIKVSLDDEAPKVASVVGLWKSAYWMEREAYDLYGIHFEGHPDMRRLLLYPEFEGHPLRKDYETEERQPRIPPREGRVHL